MSAAVAITGLGAVTALGVGVGPLMLGLVAGETGVVDGEATCAEFRPLDWLTRREVHRSARFAQMAMVAALEACEQARAGEWPYHDDEVACYLGTGLGGVEWSGLGGSVADTAFEPSALTVPLLMPNAAASAICMRLGFRGESQGIAGACAAGAMAIGAGLKAIRGGTAKAVVVGGAEAALVPGVRVSFEAAGALSQSGFCAPFDVARDGLVMGEGAAVLILEDLQAARARGATILGLVVGYGASSDAHHLTASPADARPAALAIRKALADAKCTPADIDYVNAHGTGTRLNDLAEARALRQVFGDALVDLPVSSTKGATGHAFGAGGAIEAIATVLTLSEGICPPTRGLTVIDPELGSLHALTKPWALAKARSRRLAVSNSFGFGGHNAVLVLGAPA